MIGREKARTGRVGFGEGASEKRSGRYVRLNSSWSKTPGGILGPGCFLLAGKGRTK